MRFEPKFRLTPAIRRELSHVDRAVQRIGAKKPTKHEKERSWRHFLRYFEMLEDIGPKKAHLLRYRRARNQIQAWVKKGAPLSEQKIKVLHAIILGTKTPSHYRKGQNGILDPVTKEVLYYPPRPKEVPALMKSLVNWLKRSKLPSPIRAAIAHFGINSIHPFYDGNGRTARFVTLWIVMQDGYDLQGLLCLEEYYAKDLLAYYNALSIDESHRHFWDRAHKDITSWIAYFCKGMAHACKEAFH